MFLRADNNHQIWNERPYNKPEVYCKVREEDKPPISRARFEFAAGFWAGNWSGGILSTNTNPHKESICGKSCKHAASAAMITVWSSTESRKDYEDDCREEERVGSGPFVAKIAEDKLPDNRADERNCRDILLRTRFGIRLAINNTE